MLCDESDKSGEEEYDGIGSESGSASTFSTGLGGLLHGVGLTLGVVIYADDSCDGDGGSLAVPNVIFFMEQLPEKVHVKKYWRCVSMN